MQQLTNKQLQCIELLLTSTDNKREIAKKINVTEQTLYNWFKDEHFSLELKIQEKILKENIKSNNHKKLYELVKQSIKILEDTLNDEKANKNLKSKIALIIIEKFGLFEEITDFAINENKIILETYERIDQDKITENMMKEIDKSLNFF